MKNERQSQLPTSAIAGQLRWRQPRNPSSYRGEGETVSASNFAHDEHGVIRVLSGATYADAFGNQWLRYRRTQLDSASGMPISLTRLKRCLGDEIWGTLPNVRVLEAGCGAGRFTEVLLSEGAHVVSVDLSEAVVANATNFPVDDRHLVVRADITDLPWEPGQFDVVVCLGVVQHTPDPRRTIAALAQHVRPGGWLVVDQYTDDKVGTYSLKPLYRAIIKRLPARWTLSLVQRLTHVLIPLHASCARNRLAWFALTRVSPLITYHRDIREFTDVQQFEWACLDSHDALTDWYKHPTNEAGMTDNLRNGGLSEIQVWSDGIGIEGRATLRTPVR